VLQDHDQRQLKGVQAGTKTGRAIGSLAGENLASYTAELGGKVAKSV
jgi:acyl-CoA reductase-like NAD-dependent aldehyde dehydrogenase